MTSHAQTCDADRLESYLCGTLSNAEEQTVEIHLEDCAKCQQVIEHQAAEVSSWQEASDLLGDERWRGLHNRVTAVERENGDGHSGADAAHEIASRQIRTVIETLGPTDDPAMLGRIGSYEVSGVIGCGGMGAVLKGFDRSLNRVVAIKVMAPHLASSGAARQRFSREAQAAAAITHDNVIDIYGVSEADGLPYLVMPYASGPSLQKRIDERGALPLIEVLRIGVQVAAGLAAAHEQGLVHRDIKPANILLSDGIDRLVITDFGLARAVDDATITRSGVIAGTPQYMSPEQARGEAVDHRSDLFSLGSVLYTASTGRPPFRSDSAYGILRKITDEQPRPIRELNSDAPEWLSRLIDRLHDKRATERYQSAGDVAALLQHCVAHVQTPDHPLPDELRVEPKRPWLPAWLASAVVVAGLVLWLAVGHFSDDGNGSDVATTMPPPAQVKAAGTSVPKDSENASPEAVEIHNTAEAATVDTVWHNEANSSPAKILDRAKRLNEQTRTFFDP